MAQSDNAEGGFTGAYIMLKVSEADTQRIVLADGEDADDLHLTMAFLEKPAAEYTAPERAFIENNTKALLAPFLGKGPIKANLFAYAMFNPTDPDGRCLVGLVQSEPLYRIRKVMEWFLGPDMGTKYPIWFPHVTLAIQPHMDMLTEMDEKGFLGTDIAFDELEIGWGNETKVLLRAKDQL